MSLLEVKGLNVSFRHPKSGVESHVVRDVSFSVAAGERFGLVGESGCGKSTTLLSLIGLLPASAILSGSVRFDGKELVGEDARGLVDVRGRDIGFVFQGAMNALNPVRTVGRQIAEPMLVHGTQSKRGAEARTRELLELVGIPPDRAGRYPHEFSGGMRQRVMIAMALINDPKLLIADEPTTALDVTVQAQILTLIQKLQSELDTAVVMITHDLGVVAEVTEEIAVMYAGRVVEYGKVDTIFSAPEHPYTWGLLKSIPRLDTPRDQELVPIYGRPPSLINKPSGCSFHPRCPYVRDAHKKVDPGLEPTGGADPEHKVACLLPGQTRRSLWSALQAGETPEAAIEEVPIPETTLSPSAEGHTGEEVPGS
jgi:peptide/nickel transport system ATP-binding protein